VQEKKEKIKNLKTSERPSGTYNTTSKRLKNKTGLDREINVWDALTTPNELLRETLINFMWGFLGNSIVVFVAKELDFMVLINYIVYYILISYIVNRKKYETMLGKFIVLPGSAAAGAFTGYKLAQIIAQMI
jgi:hypothetical protein